MEDNDKEIVQTLKNHIDAEDCVTCESFGKCDEFLLTKNTLDLINRQQAKIEALQMDNEQLQSDIINANMNLEHQQAEIEQLKTNNTLLRQDINADTAEIRALRRKFDIAKFEAVKEFIERLKERLISKAIDNYRNDNENEYYLSRCVLDEIDSLVKEIEGDTE